jgi:hypothetical protein
MQSLCEHSLERRLGELYIHFFYIRLFLTGKWQIALPATPFSEPLDIRFGRESHDERKYRIKATACQGYFVKNTSTVV